jgi:hypothetical protein
MSSYQIALAPLCSSHFSLSALSFHLYQLYVSCWPAVCYTCAMRLIHEKKLILFNSYVISYLYSIYSQTFFFMY